MTLIIINPSSSERVCCIAVNWSESWQRWLNKIPHLLGLTCSSLNICCVGQVTTVSHHNQSVLSARNKPLEMPLFQVFPLPRFFLCAIRVVKIQLIEVDVSCCWPPGEPQTVCHVSVGCLETNNWRWYWKKGSGYWTSLGWGEATKSNRPYTWI